MHRFPHTFIALTAYCTNYILHLIKIQLLFVDSIVQTHQCKQLHSSKT